MCIRCKRPRNTKLYSPWQLLAGLLALAAGLSVSPATSAGRTQTISDSSHLHLLAGKSPRGQRQRVDRGRSDVRRSPRHGQDLPDVEIQHAHSNGELYFYTKSGMLTGHASGRLKIGKGPYDSFAGYVQINGGSSHFHGAHGNGEMYGAINRDTYAMTVQVTGTLHY
jgi:hypothetical protein